MTKKQNSIILPKTKKTNGKIPNFAKTEAIILITQFRYDDECATNCKFLRLSTNKKRKKFAKSFCCSKLYQITIINLIKLLIIHFLAPKPTHCASGTRKMPFERRKRKQTRRHATKLSLLKRLITLNFGTLAASRAKRQRTRFEERGWG